MQTCIISFNAPPPPPPPNSSPFSQKTHQPNTLFFTSTVTNRPSIQSTPPLSRKLICRPPAGKYISDDYLVIPNTPTLYFRRRCSSPTHILSAGRNYQLNQNDDFHTEPFWLNPIREAFWNTRSLLLFLIEQPGQLKYIEWPSFQSTLKTATLTLVLVAMLIVALSSVDSALSYLLALLLRRKA